MDKLTIEQLDVTGKTVLMRVDFNVPLDNEGNVLDATRIEASLASIRYVLGKGGSLILMSHLGRPHHQFRADLSLKPVAQFLSSLIHKPVIMAPDCIGDEVQQLVLQLKAGDILMLENLRFHRAEEHPEEDLGFSEKLANYGDCYINDAFGTAHRKHSSTYYVAKHFPTQAAAGFLLQDEIHYLGNALLKPERPFIALLGGAKVSTKIAVIEALLKKVDHLVIGGGMAYTFLKAKGYDIGSSLLEEDFLPLAASLLQQYSSQILLPTDCVAAVACSEDSPTRVISMEQGIPLELQGLDIGPDTLKVIKKLLATAKTILWNGPFGVYELAPFSLGTTSLAKFIAHLPVTKIVGGGDLIAAIKQAGVFNQMTHISTGGGATLEYIQYGTLPGIEALSPAKLLFSQS